MKSDNDGSARIVILRIQDGAHETDEYTGKIKEINNKLHVTFCDNQEDGSTVNHLLKIEADGMEWVRSGSGGKSRTAFRAGESLPFLFTAPYGDIKMQLVTDSYSYTKKDTHIISVSYSLKHGDELCSEYNTRIEIFTL